MHFKINRNVRTLSHNDLKAKSLVSVSTVVVFITVTPEYCDECVCVCLSVSDHISGTTHLIFTKFFVHVVYGCGSVLLWWHRDKLHISGFVDDVISAHKLIGCSHGSTSTSAFNLMPSSLVSFHVFQLHVLD